LEAIDTMPQSEINANVEQKKEEATAKKGGRMKYVIVFVFCLLLIGVLAYSAHLDELASSSQTPQLRKTVGKGKRAEEKRKAKKARSGQ
jgi:hypothetical protein